MCYSHGISWSMVSDHTCKCGIRQVTGRGGGDFKKLLVWERRERKRMKKRREGTLCHREVTETGKREEGETDGGIGLKFASGLQCKCPFSVPVESGKICITPYCFRGELINCWP